MKSIYEIKQNALSDKGKEMAKELEDLNWELQEKNFELVKLQKKFQYKELLYKEFLGYDVKSEDIDKLLKELGDD